MTSTSETRVALVTGANKGIGLGIVRGLCQKFQGVVYLTARDQTRGMEAVKKLNSEGLQPEFLRLDISDINSIQEVRKFLENKHGGLDILVNNAAILPNVTSKEAFPKDAERTIATNFTGTMNMFEQMLPLLRSHARVVNLTSSLGALEKVKIPQVKERLLADDLTMDELTKIMADYLAAVRTGDYLEKGYLAGYPDTFGAYPMSKVGITALTRVEQRILNQDKTRTDLVVNAVHPGYVNTDLTQGKGYLSVEKGAEPPIFLALLPAGKEVPKGQYFNSKKLTDWSKT